MPATAGFLREATKAPAIVNSVSLSAFLPLLYFLRDCRRLLVTRIGHAMNQQEITDFLLALGHVTVLVASEANGSPPQAWGDTFFFMTDTDGEAQKMPFSTIVTRDYKGFDEASQLDRGGLFRLNADLGKERFREVFGYLPADHPSKRNEYDFTAVDVLFPHPAYAEYGWASIINPSDKSAAKTKEVLLAAHQRAMRKIGSRLAASGRS
jgi:hypothetical protein